MVTCVPTCPLEGLNPVMAGTAVAVAEIAARAGMNTVRATMADSAHRRICRPVGNHRCHDRRMGSLLPRVSRSTRPRAERLMDAHTSMVPGARGQMVNSARSRSVPRWSHGHTGTSRDRLRGPRAPRSVLGGGAGLSGAAAAGRVRLVGGRLAGVGRARGTVELAERRGRPRRGRPTAVLPAGARGQGREEPGA